MINKLFLVGFSALFSLSNLLWAEEKIGDCLACHQRIPGDFQGLGEQQALQSAVIASRQQKPRGSQAQESTVEPEVCARCHAEQFGQFQKVDIP
jgi:hypothetical protein